MLFAHRANVAARAAFHFDWLSRPAFSGGLKHVGARGPRPAHRLRASKRHALLALSAFLLRHGALRSGIKAISRTSPWNMIPPILRRASATRS
jgi:hypothetical protein